MLYEFTITLRPRLYSMTPQEQYDYCYPILRTILGDYKCSCIAELSQENNVHFHAKIDLKDFRARDILLNKFRKHHTIFGKKTCTQLINEPQYDEYMRKDMKKTGEIIKDYQVMDYFEIYGNMNPKYFSEMKPKDQIKLYKILGYKYNEGLDEFEI